MKLTNKLIGLICVLTLIAVPGYAESSPFEKMGVVPAKTFKSAPDFVLQNVQGETVKLSDFKGKVLLLNFWATWCAACKEEMASMQNLYSTVDGVEVLAISIDRWNEERVQEYVKKNNLTFPVLLDQDQEVRKQYFVMGLPTSYLIDGEGKIRGYASGARAWDSPDSKNLFLALKKEGRLSMQENQARP